MDQAKVTAALLAEMLELQSKHDRSCAEHWDKHPEDYDQDGDNDYEVAHAQGRACGLQSAANQIRKYLLGESSGA